MMNANSIASADILDIIFDGRFKEYGAYQLRRQYHKRMAVSLFSVLSISGLVLLLALNPFVEKISSGPAIQPDDTIRLVNLKPGQIALTVPQTHTSHARQLTYTAPLIVKEITMDEKEMPPVTDVNISVISTNNQGGSDETSNQPPSESLTPGIAAKPAATVFQEDTIFRTAEFPATFPGDWKRFLERNLVYPETAVESNIQGMVRLEFVVDKTGSISDIKALNDPGEGLAAEAIRIIKKSPKWNPAVQNGRKVNFRSIQTITFRLE